jgi:hypothetical protein
MPSPIAPAGKLKSACLWIASAVAAFLYVPYLMGGIYAVISLPVFSAICGTSSSPISFVRDPVDSGDYEMFLHGQGCKLPPQDVENTEVGLGSITPEYKGMHQYFSNDILGNLFAHIGQYWGRLFQEGTNGTAVVVTAALRTNVLVRAVFYIGYFLVVALALKLLGKAVDDVWRHFRQGKSGTN